MQNYSKIEIVTIQLFLKYKTTVSKKCGYLQYNGVQNTKVPEIASRISSLSSKSKVQIVQSLSEEKNV